MPDELPTASVERAHVAKIVGAYVERNQIAPDQLASLISIVHKALGGLGRSPAEPASGRNPAVSVRRSVTPDFVFCMDCGWRGQVLRRHLATAHGLTVDGYRARWNLSREHLLTAPAYSERRSAMAKQIGLGRGVRRASEPTTPQPGRRGRPRSTATTA